MMKALFSPAARCLVTVTVLLGLCSLRSFGQGAAIPLGGNWRFALDRGDVGISERWFAKDLPDRIQLPGVLQAQGFGDEISTTTPWVLSLYDKLWYLRADYAAYTNAGHVKVPFLCQPPRHYVGAAWYQRDIETPEDWHGFRRELILERPHWQTAVWFDDRCVGTNNSLCAPHVYDLAFLGGKHRLTIRVDNRMLLPYRPDAHAVSDSLGSSWNGIVGKIELRPTRFFWIEDAQVFPNAEKRSARIKVRIGCTGPTGGAGTLSAGLTNVPVSWTTSGGQAEFEIQLPHETPLWDEFNPHLLTIPLRFTVGEAQEARRLTFGFRDFRADGQQFTINGRPTHLRGTHHGGDFPLTGYPPCDVEYWRKVFKTCKDWGLNHVRFHSFCPPEAAFSAADELGLYLQIEPGMWNTFNPSTPMEAMLYAETERILKAYGNHPSFVMIAASNEPKGRWRDVLPKWAAHFRAADPRRLYTTGTGFNDPDAPGPLDRVDFTATQRFGGRQVRGATGWFGGDYARSIEGVRVPIVTHEVGQWCAYPDFDVIKKFTGYAQPGNYEIFRDSAVARGRPRPQQGAGASEAAAGEGARAPIAADSSHLKDLAHASGRFQLACYKEEIEANLRTPGLNGFQLLDLHDYTGQGTALVGLLDPFWEEKGYVKADEWRQFCSPTVPLARLTRRVFTTADRLEADVDLAHWGMAPLTNCTLSWRVVSSTLWPYTNGAWQLPVVPIAGGTKAGRLSVDLSGVKGIGSRFHAARITDRTKVHGAEQMTLWVEGRTAAGLAFSNSWPFWVYPKPAETPQPKGVFITSSWSAAEKQLADGRAVLFLPRSADLGWDSPPLDRVPIFWNRLMNPGWSRFLGLHCQVGHGALADFPTERYCDWQWTELTRGARTINLDHAPRELQPVVQAIDDWNRNWKLGCIFEARVGSGRLLVCSFDLQRDLENRPVAATLRQSLLNYLGSEWFRPQVTLTPEQARGLWFDTRIMTKLGARATADGRDASAVLDGDPNTFWNSGGGSRGGASGSRHPHELTITFTNAVPMTGLVLMNRQNDRDHLGDIRGYTLAASDDGQTWREILRGELASTWNPLTVKFPAATTAKALKLTALSGFGSDPTAALADLAVLYAGPALPENPDASTEIRRTRSTSTDVDEGADPAPVRPPPAPR